MTVETRQAITETIRMDKGEGLEPGDYYVHPDFASDGSNAVVSLPKFGDVTLDGINIDGTTYDRMNNENLRIVRSAAVSASEGLNVVVIRNCHFRGAPSTAIDLSQTRHAAAPLMVEMDCVEVDLSYYGIDQNGVGQSMVVDSMFHRLSGLELRNDHPQPRAMGHDGWCGWNAISGAPLEAEYLRVRAWGDNKGNKVGEGKDTNGDLTDVPPHAVFRECELSNLVVSGAHVEVYDSTINGHLRTWRDKLDEVGPAISWQEEGNVPVEIKLYDTVVVSHKINLYNLNSFGQPIDNSQRIYQSPRALQMFGTSQLFLA